MSSDIRHVHIDEIELAYHWTRGPSTTPLVFLHGLGDSSILTFAPISHHPALEDHPALLIDLPGFGHSRAPDDWSGAIEDHAEAVIAALNSMRVRSATIVGHSMGGSLALLVTARRPDLVNRLILAEPLLHREHSTLGISVARRSEREFVTRGYEMLRLATRRQAARGDRAAAGFQEPLALANPAILHRSAVSLLGDRSPTFLKVLEGMSCPRTVVVGERTAIETDFLPAGVTQVRIPAAGHSMMSENPHAFAVAIAREIEGEFGEGMWRAASRP